MSSIPNFINKTTEWILGLFIVSWVFTESINNFIIIICALFWLGSRGYESLFELRRNYFVLWSLAFIAVLTFSVIYSTDTEEAWRLIGRRALIPLIIIIFPHLISFSEEKKLLKIYVITWFFVSIYSLANTYFTYGIDFNNLAYYSWLLPKSIDISSTYYTLFIGFSFIIILSDIADRSIFKSRYLIIGLAIYFFCFLTLLSSRAPLLAATLTALLFPFFYFPKWSKKRVAAYIGSIVTISSLITLASPFLRNKVSQLFYGNDPHFFEITAGLQVFIKNPLIGAGIGDAQNELISAYKTIGFVQGIQENFNVHNEFLYAAMTIGVAGVILMGSIVIMCIRSAMKSMSYLQLGFSIIFFSCCMSEVLLNRQKGITFFAFFVALLFIKSNEENLAH
jgi:O-antigen ligase